MRKAILILVLCIVIAALTALMIWGINAGSSWLMSWWPLSAAEEQKAPVPGTLVPVSSFEAETKDVGSIRIHAGEEDVSVSTGSGTTISVTQEAGDGFPSQYIVKTALKGSVLEIETAPETSFGRQRNRPYSRIVVTIPAGFEVPVSAAATIGDIKLTGIAGDRVEAETKSGKIEVADAKTLQLNASTTSGNLIIADADAKSLEASSASSAIQITSAVCTALSASSESGAVAVHADVSGNENISTTTGSIRVSGTAAHATLRTLYGDLSAEYESLRSTDATTKSGSVFVSTAKASQLERIDVDSASGNVTLALPEGTSINLNFSSVSGSMSAGSGSGKLLIGGNGAIPINVSTKTGDLSLRAL